MPRKCCVTGCRANYKSQEGYVTVFLFPKDADRRTQWINAIARPNYVVSKHSGVCIAHFPEPEVIRHEAYIDRDGLLQTVQRSFPMLKKDAVPSLGLVPPAKRRNAASSPLKETRASQKAQVSPLKETRASQKAQVSPLKGTRAPGRPKKACLSPLKGARARGRPKKTCPSPVKETRASQKVSPSPLKETRASQKASPSPLKETRASQKACSSPLKEIRASLIPQKARPSPLNVRWIDSDRIIRSGSVNGFNQLQNSFVFRLNGVIKDGGWSVKLERDNYLLFYKTAVSMETLTPTFTSSVCVKNDLQVNVSAADRIIDRSMLKTFFGIRAGKLEQWSSLEKVLTAPVLGLPAAAAAKESPPAVEESPCPARLVNSAVEELRRAAELLENDVDCGPSLALSHAAEQARLAVTPSCSRRYSDRLRRAACILFARSPDVYRLLRRLHLLSLPVEHSLKRHKRPPLALSRDITLTLMPI